MPDNTPELDLSACEREPIRIPGSIQPHGLLLAVDAEGVVRAASDNAEALWRPVLGHALGELFDLDRMPFDAARSAENAQHVGTIEGFDVFAHRSGEHLLVELERRADAVGTAEALAGLLASATAIGEAADLGTAAEAAAEAVRTITGYDRVMVYRFLPDGSGQVIAEAREPTIDPLLNHRYPASDIPRQARALYLTNRIRVIADVGYEPVPLRSPGEAIDLGGALLRSVSPVHIQYLKNMGVGASASVSIVHGGELWGLIACHHMTPRPIGHERREMARHVALSLEGAIARLEEEASHREALRLIQRREEVLPYLAGAESLGEGLARHPERLLGAIPSDGVAILFDEELVTHGVTPPLPAIRELAGDALERSRLVRATDRLSESYPAAAEWTAKASGLLTAVVSRRPAFVVLWFRAEEVETVNWAGNPHAPADRDESGTLCPRRSFEIWAEQVRGRSRPWRPNELDAARQLAVRLREIAERKALNDLNRHLGETLEARDAALEQKDLLMREVHHRVQNNLQLVTSMLRLQENEVEDAASRRQLELARDRIQSISVLHRRLWRSDDLELVNLESFFAELTDDLASAWGDEWRKHIARDVAPLRIPGPSALLLGLVVTELLTNAFKHAYDGAPGAIALSVEERGKSRLAITVADKGVGPGAGLERSGSFGSRLIQRLVAQLSGELEVADARPGTAVTLVIPRPKAKDAA